MKINLIRHGKTKGNTEKRYIGRTDEPLCEIGINELMKYTYPKCDAVISSSMKRCTETAHIIYNDMSIITDSGFRETDFGDFEGHNYEELKDSPLYQKWIDSCGEMPFPNGESRAECDKRIISAFERHINEHKGESLSFVVHGGTIMTVMEKFCVPKKNYYEYQVPNGCGYECLYSDGKLEIINKIGDF